MSEKYITECFACDPYIGSYMFDNINYKNIHILSIGTAACIRSLYFEALSRNMLDRFSMIELNKISISLGNHIFDVEKEIKRVLQKKEMDAVVIYLSCPDLIAKIDYESIFKEIELYTNKKVFIFKRGPIQKRIQLPKDRIKEIKKEIDEIGSGLY